MEKPKGINIKNEDGNVLADMELPDAKGALAQVGTGYTDRQDHTRARP